MVGQAFLSMTCHFIFLVSCIHASYKTSSEMLNVEFISKRLRNMRDQWEARLSIMENVQEKFEHDIREMEEQLARLTSLFEDMAVHPRGPHPCRINGSLDHSSRPRAICHVELIAPTYGNKSLQLHLPSGQHIDPLICQAAQRANLKDKRLRRTSPNRIPSPLATPNYS